MILSQTPTPYPVPSHPLLIIVGVTGVGKTTTLHELEQLGVAFTLLPNRREVTDQFIFAGEKVSDRAERFKRTAEFKTTYSGGMGQLLCELYLGEEPSGLLVFDGLRGLNEVEYAFSHSQARFIVLDAPDAVRATRLLQRNDSFDHMSGATVEHSVLASLHALKGVEQVFSPEDLAVLAALPASPEDIVSKVKIVVEERNNYNPKDANAYLLAQHAPQRVLYLDTAQHNPEQVALRIRGWL